MNTTPQRRTHQLGLTLVEVLIASVLLAIISTILLDALQLAARVWRSPEQSEARMLEAASVRAWLRRELSQARPMTLTLEGGRSSLAFVGKPDALGFVAPLPAHLGGGGLAWIELRMEDHDDGRRLVMTHELFHPDVDEASLEDARVLIDAVESIRFSYFGAPERGHPASWHDSWTEMEYLPSLVRLAVDTGNDRRTMSWPDIIAAPMTDGSRPPELRPLAQLAAARTE